MLQSLEGWTGFLLNYDLLSMYGYRLIQGLWITVQVVLISCSVGFLLAYPICLARRSKNIILSNLALGYITFFRGTPLLCQLYLVYYGAGEFRPLLQSVNLWWFFREAFYCCILAFTMNTAAYQAEIMRGRLGLGCQGPGRGCDGAWPVALPGVAARHLAAGGAGWRCGLWPTN